MASQVGYWVLVALGFGGLILIHELGHFLACRLVGVRVIRFSLGFGPRLFGTNKFADEKGEDSRSRRTDYCISVIPCGGYVKMAGGEGEKESSGASDEFPSKTPGQRALVILAGPFMNLVVAVPILLALFVGGMERPSSMVDRIVPGSPAWNAGLKRGDLITGLRERGDDSWKTIRLCRELKYNSVLKDVVGDITLRVERDGREMHIDLTTDDHNQMGIGWNQVGPDVGCITTIAGYVPEDGAAERAGITPGSRIVEFAGRKVHTWDDVIDATTANPGAEVPVVFVPPGAGGKRRATTVAIGVETFQSIGIKANRPNRVRRVRPGFPAERAGLKPGDTITAVQGQAVRNWPELSRAVVDAAPGEAALTVVRDGKTSEVRVALDRGDRIGDALGIAADKSPVVEGFLPKSDAEKAGVKVGATLLSVEFEASSGGPLDLAGVDRTELRAQLAGRRKSDTESQRVAVALEQGGVKKTVTITTVGARRGELDLSPRLAVVRAVPAGRPFAAVGQAFVETGQWIRIAARGLWLLVSGQLPLKLLSGPVMILTATRFQAEAGTFRFLEFLVLITIHLGIINLVPFPILDGGHIAFIAIEKLRGKPMSEKVVGYLMYGGMAVLIALMIFVTFNDVLQLSRIFGR